MHSERVDTCVGPNLQLEGERAMKVLAWIVMALALTMGGCSGTEPLQENSRGYVKITPQEAKKIIDSDKDIILLDVRTPEEYNEKHIPGSVLIPVDDIRQKAEGILKDKNAKILIYCRSGRRSAIAAEELAAMGYGNLYDFGGIIDWPYETEK